VAAEQGPDEAWMARAVALAEVQRDWLDGFAPLWEQSLERLKVAAESEI